jgi:hypothetical protein
MSNPNSDWYVPWEYFLSVNQTKYAQTTAICTGRGNPKPDTLKKAVVLLGGKSKLNKKDNCTTILELTTPIRNAIIESDNSDAQYRLAVEYLDASMQDKFEDDVEIPVKPSVVNGVAVKEERAKQSESEQREIEEQKESEEEEQSEREEEQEEQVAIDTLKKMSKKEIFAELEKREWLRFEVSGKSVLMQRNTQGQLANELYRVIHTNFEPLFTLTKSFIKQQYPKIKKSELVELVKERYPGVYTEDEILGAVTKYVKEVVAYLKTVPEEEKLAAVSNIWTVRPASPRAVPQIQIPASPRLSPRAVPRIEIPSSPRVSPRVVPRIEIPQPYINPIISDYIQRRNWRGLAEGAAKEDVCDFVFNNIIDEEKEMDIQFNVYKDQINSLNREIADLRAQLRQSIADLTSARRSKSAERISEIRSKSYELKDAALERTAALERLEQQVKNIDCSKQENTDICQTMQQWLTEAPLSPRKSPEPVVVEAPVEIVPEPVVAVPVVEAAAVVTFTDASEVVKECNVLEEYATQEEALKDLDCGEKVCDVIEKKCISEEETLGMRVQNVQIGDKEVQVTGKKAYQSVDEIKERLRKFKGEEVQQEEIILSTKPKLFETRVPDVETLSKTLQAISSKPISSGLAKPSVAALKPGQTLAQQRLAMEKLKAKDRLQKALRL